jgi:hypothetical protein
VVEWFGFQIQNTKSYRQILNFSKSYYFHITIIHSMFFMHILCSSLVLIWSSGLFWIIWNGMKGRSPRNKQSPPIAIATTDDPATESLLHALNPDFTEYVIYGICNEICFRQSPRLQCLPGGQSRGCYHGFMFGHHLNISDSLRILESRRYDNRSQ